MKMQLCGVKMPIGTDSKNSKCVQPPHLILKRMEDEKRRIRPGFEDYNLVEEYIDIFGDKIRTYKSGNMEIVESNGLCNKVPGTQGHAFMEGWYIINEKGEEVNMFDDEEYKRIESLYEYKARLKLRLHMDFTGYSLKEGPNNTVCIEDREIVPDCYWGLPINDEEVQQKFDEIIKKVLEYKT
jgi:hypothetical protein